MLAIALCSLAASSLAVGQATAAIIVLTPTADQSGSTTALESRSSALLSAFGSTSTTGGKLWRSAMEFGLSSIPAGSTIGSASLALTPMLATGTPLMQLHGFGGNGSIQLSDLSTSNLISTFTAVPLTTAIVDATPFVQSLVLGPSSTSPTFAGFMIRTNAVEGVTTFNGASFGSSENTIAAFVPTLTVDFTPPSGTPGVPAPGLPKLLTFGGGGSLVQPAATPEPSSVVIFAGLIASGVMFRRRRLGAKTT